MWQKGGSVLKWLWKLYKKDEIQLVYLFLSISVTFSSSASQTQKRRRPHLIFTSFAHACLKLYLCVLLNISFISNDTRCRFTVHADARPTVRGWRRWPQPAGRWHVTRCLLPPLPLAAALPAGRADCGGGVPAGSLPGGQAPPAAISLPRPHAAGSAAARRPRLCTVSSFRAAMCMCHATVAHRHL